MMYARAVRYIVRVGEKVEQYDSITLCATAERVFFSSFSDRGKDSVFARINHCSRDKTRVWRNVRGRMDGRIRRKEIEGEVGGETNKNKIENR